MAESLRLDLGLTAPHRARAWVAEVCAGHGLDDLIDDAALLMSELVTNAVVHAHSDCTILIDFGERSMCGQVVDQDERDVLVGVAGDGAEGGRGLGIVAAVAREWGVTRHLSGKSVWFVLEGEDGSDGIDRARGSGQTSPPERVGVTAAG